jgi:hypothetical protein
MKLRLQVIDVLSTGCGTALLLRQISVQVTYSQADEALVRQFALSTGNPVESFVCTQENHEIYLKKE